MGVYWQLPVDLEWYACPHCQAKIALRRFADGRFTVVSVTGELHSHTCKAFAHRLNTVTSVGPVYDLDVEQLKLDLFDDCWEDEGDGEFL